MSLTLNDADLPSSAVFVDFLYCDLTGEPFYVGSWHAQEEESLSQFEGRFEGLKEKTRLVIANPQGRRRIRQSRAYFKEMLTGCPRTIKALQRYRYYLVMGIPRSGGTYLTKQLFRAAGLDYKKVPAALAHDGFPNLGTAGVLEQGDSFSAYGLLQLAEYLTMVDIYFGKSGHTGERRPIVVPKKFTSGVYGFPLIRAVLGEAAQYIITLRHPLSMIQSILDKSGGMPDGNVFALRSAVERWALDEWLRWGAQEDQVKGMSYVDVFLGYWKRYHFRVAMNAIPTVAGTRILIHDAANMKRAARKFYGAFGSSLDPEPFKQAATPGFAPEDRRKSDVAVRQVAHFWQSLGIAFPLKAVLEAN